MLIKLNYVFVQNCWYGLEDSGEWCGIVKYWGLLWPSAANICDNLTSIWFGTVTRLLRMNAGSSIQPTVVEIR